MTTSGMRFLNRAMTYLLFFAFSIWTQKSSLCHTLRMNRLVFIFSILVASGLCLQADDKSNSSLPWLSSLQLIEMPSTSAPIVCVPNSGSVNAGEKPSVSYAIGVLEQDNGNNCKIWLTNFQQQDIYRDGWQRYGVDPDKTVRKLTALEAAKLWCEWLDTETLNQRSMRAGGPMEEFARMLVLAAVFQQRGETEAANLLERRALSLPPNRGGNWPSNRNFDHDLRENLAEALMRAVKTDCGNAENTRTTLEQRLTQIAQHLPDTKEAGEAASLAKALRAVIESDALAEKNKLTDEALARLPIQERIAALIRLLPDQTGHQNMMPGYCNIFSDEPSLSTFMIPGLYNTLEKPKGAITPAGKLFLIGMEAVPQLIEATEDRRPTRAFGLGKPHWQRSSLLDVGDCAFQILQRLSGRTFYPREYTGDPAIDSAAMKRNVQAWWEEVKNGTEAEKLDQEISQGGGRGGPGSMPARLAEIAPERVVGAIERGLGKAGNSWNGDWLVYSLATVDSAPARELMQRLITQGRYLSVRMTAARFVHQSTGSFNGKPSPVYSEADQQAARQAMLHEWKKFPGSSERREPFDGNKLAELIASMAIKAPSMFPSITVELPFHTPDVRAQLINNLTAYSRMMDQNPRPSVAPALELFLAGQLEDGDFAPTVTFNKSNLMNGRGARVAEFAANLLHQLWPDRYPFNWNVSADEIEEARIACLNNWRSSQHLPAIVPAVLPLGDKDDPSTVTAITMGNNSQALPPTLKPQVDDWLNKPLSGDSIVTFLADFAKANKEDTLSVSLTATRSSARSGFTVKLTIGNEQEPSANGNSHHYVIVDGKHLMQTSGGMELHLAQRSDLSDYTKFKQHIATALTAPASAPIYIEGARLIGRKK